MSDNPKLIEIDEPNSKDISLDDRLENLEEDDKESYVRILKEELELIKDCLEKLLSSNLTSENRPCPLPELYISYSGLMYEFTCYQIADMSSGIIHKVDYDKDRE
ncbi:MAG: hypothetical protein ABSA75_12165 [Candidatus Bathyarchaeia archaeon]|jgi:hypothetical protein